jgi:polyribonucleotide nucleotidyltransferase
MGGGRRIDKVEDVLALGDKVGVVVREIDDRGKVSLDLAEGVQLVDGAAESGAAPSGDGGSRSRNRDRDRNDGRRRDRSDRRDRDQGDERRQASKPGRTVVSFEDDFEDGL